MFGGYSLLAAPHHITLRNIEISGLTMSSDGKPHGYAVYSSHAAAPGPNNILFEDFTSIDTGQISGHLHWYHDYLDDEHSPAGNYNAQNVVVRRAHLTGPTAQVGGGTNTAAFYIWASTLNNLLIEDTDIHNAAGFVIRYEGGSGVILRRVVSTGTGLQPFYSSKGANPPGVTFESSSLR